MADSEAETAEVDRESPCRSVTFEGDPFTHCTIDPRQNDISLRLSGPDGKPLRSLENLRNIEPDVVLAMNAGMFDEGGYPIGLYVENAEELHAANTNGGEGNFHLKPNGVFHGGNGTWRVSETGLYLSLEMAGHHPFVTQSGPMLVINGELHPAFAANGDSLHIRNGVGVDAADNVHFVISDRMVSFGRFARFFRDEAKTPNALYLDGAVSALLSPADGRLDPSPPLGPLIVVTERAKAAP